MTYTINLPVFEGPFDLLLHLVKVNEMEVSDINIAEITDQYLKTLGLMQEFDLEVAGDFLVMAATLINLKVRALLPDPPEEEETDEESEEIAEIFSARQLMQQLIEYRKFKELSVDLSDRQEEQMRVYCRHSLLPALEDAQESAPLRSEIGLLFDCFARVLRYVEERPHHDVAFEPFSVEERIGVIRRRLQFTNSLELFSLFHECRNKADAIVSLLALLELSRLKHVRLEQNEHYDNVFVYRRDPHLHQTESEEIETDSEDVRPNEANPPEGPAEVVDAARPGAESALLNEPTATDEEPKDADAEIAEDRP